MLEQVNKQVLHKNIEFLGVSILCLVVLYIADDAAPVPREIVGDVV